MARFIRHESCPKCGSRDNLGVYDDGSKWCFGCHYYGDVDISKWKPREESNGREFSGTSHTQYLLHGLRDGVAYPPEVVAYLARFDISVPEAYANNARWKPSTRALCFIYYDLEGKPCCVQERSFSGNPKTPKYLTSGSSYEAFDLIGTKGKEVAITEDKLSAIVVGRVCDASPALGTTYQQWKLLELFKRGYRRVYVWLDKDKWREGREICEKAQWIGMSATAVLTDLDPKCYSQDEIKGYLK